MDYITNLLPTTGVGVLTLVVATALVVVLARAIVLTLKATKGMSLKTKARRLLDHITFKPNRDAAVTTSG